MADNNDGDYGYFDADKNIPEVLQRLGRSVNRLERLTSLNAPEIIIVNETDMLVRRAKDSIAYCEGLIQLYEGDLGG